MAKSNHTNMPLSGKLGNEVHNTGKYGNIVKKAPKKGSGKNLSGILEFSNGQGFRNNVSGCINRIANHYNTRLKGSRFYHRMLSCFKNEPENNRFLLLLQLKGLEVNPLYQLQKLIYSDLTYKQTEDSLVVNIDVKHHPQESQYRADCYDHELLLLCWDKTSDPPIVERQLSPWISINGGLPELTFTFKKRENMTHWLLILRVRLGVKEQPLEFLVTEGMRIMAVGSFDAKEIALMKEKEDERIAKAVGRTKPEVVEEVRVGVVRMKG